MLRSMGKRLLVMACSSRKVSSSGPLPAIERYDGVAFRVVKRLRRLGRYPHNVDVLIVSAKYGLIRHDQPIDNYDLRMTPERALEQVEQNRAILRQLVDSSYYSEVFVSVGKVYLMALEPFDAWQGSVIVTVNSGKIGVQLRSLKQWLLRVK